MTFLLPNLGSKILNHPPQAVYLPVKYGKCRAIITYFGSRTL